MPAGHGFDQFAFAEDGFAQGTEHAQRLGLRKLRHRTLHGRDDQGVDEIVGEVEPGRLGLGR
jgi:hypothetical protein